MAAACPQCACTTADAGGAHALQALLAAGDLDAALANGLLEARPCPGCDAACTARLLAAREQRRFALAARERHVARAARLLRRKAERDTLRSQPTAPAARMPALPAGAADVLARALAKAAERKPR
ncbi:MAG TPA: hypothetical protein VN205_04715 [Thermomonas sp.]|nr:hypothetical protein [Thermomonas sp.]